MNLPAANSGGSAGPIPPPPLFTIEVWLPDGSCIPATPATCKRLLKQARSDELKKRKAARQEKADELQRNLEDRAAAWRLLQELAEIDRERRRVAAKLRAVAVKDLSPPRRTSNVKKRVVEPVHSVITPTMTSSWAIDDLGMRGVHYAQSYLGRKSPDFYPGAARDRWEYEARDEAVLRDSEGKSLIIANIGDDVDEIAAGWQCIEDATTRLNGKIQIRIVVALDADASPEEDVAALKHFCETVLGSLGLPYSAVIHRPNPDGDQRNVHGHILTSFRPTERVAPYCWAFSDEVRGELDGKNGVQMLRHLWAHSMSEAAEQAERNMRYTGLGYGARGLDLEAGEHLGERRSAMVARGATVWPHERNRIKNARNSMRRAIRDADRKIAALTQVRDAALAEMQAEREGRAERKLVAKAPFAQRPALGVASRLSVGPARREQSPAGKRRVPLVALPELGAAPRLTSSPGSVRAQAQREGASLPPQHRRLAVILGVPPSMPAASLAGTSFAEKPPKRLVASGPTDIAIKQCVASSVLTPPNVLAAAQPVAAFPKSLASPSDATGDASHEMTLGSSARTAPQQRLSVSPASTPVSTNPLLANIDELLHRLARERSGRDMRRKAEASTKLALPVEQADIGWPAGSTQSDAGRVDARRGGRGLPETVRGARWRRASNAGADHARRGGAEMHSLRTRFWLEANPATPYTADNVERAENRARLDRLIRIDAYVAHLDEGGFDIDPSALIAIGADAAWLARPAAQQSLARLREEQQRVMARLAAEAARRPLNFLNHGTRFWPADLPPGDRRRLDVWATDPGFQNDVWKTEQVVGAAHKQRDAEWRAVADIRLAKPSAEPSRKLARPIADGFGGMRDTARSPFAYKPVGPSVLAFDRTSGAPTKPLLMLLHFCGERPRDIDFADDGRLIGDAGIPKSIDILIRSWRHDDRLQALVVETVRASREAGHPIYPAEHASAIRTLALQASSRPRNPGPDNGPSR